MPRTTIAAIVATPPTTSTTYVGVAAAATAADTGNQNQTPCTGKEFIHARNSGVSARTVTVTSAPDLAGRTQNITADALASGITKIYGPFPVDGWKQADGMLYFEANHAEVLFTVIRTP